ncbi:hypothetical protein Tco_0483633 [Tanacetum coccineum]
MSLHEAEGGGGGGGWAVVRVKSVVMRESMRWVSKMRNLEDERNEDYGSISLIHQAHYGHVLTKHPNIPKRANEPHHMIANDDFVKFIFVTRNFEARGIGIHVALLNEDIMQTNAYKVYDVDFKKKKKKGQISGESSVPSITLKFKIKKRQHDLETPIPTAEQVEIEQMTEAQKLSYTLAVNPGTRIDPGSDKETPEAVNVAYDDVVVEEENSAYEAPIWKKRKRSLEVRDTPIATPPRSPRIDVSSDKDDQLQELTATHVSSSEVAPPSSS